MQQPCTIHYYTYTIYSQVHIAATCNNHVQYTTTLIQYTVRFILLQHATTTYSTLLHLYNIQSGSYCCNMQQPRTVHYYTYTIYSQVHIAATCNKPHTIRFILLQDTVNQAGTYSQDLKTARQCPRHRFVSGGDLLTGEGAGGGHSTFIPIPQLQALPFYVTSPVATPGTLINLLLLTTAVSRCQAV